MADSSGSKKQRIMGQASSEGRSFKDWDAKEDKKFACQKYAGNPSKFFNDALAKAFDKKGDLNEMA